LHKADSYFGSKRPSDLAFGCYDPGSIVSTDTNVYFFDVINKAYIRSAPNGMYPVSDYYMKSFWREIGDTLALHKGEYYMTSVFLRVTSELYITFRRREGGSELLPQEFTVHFHEASNRWKSFWPFVPECYGETNNQMVTFYNGQLYKHEAKSIYNNFNGSQHPMIIDAYSNDTPKQVKVYQSLTVHSNRVFYCPDKGDIYILPTENYPNGMMSRLTKAQFDPQEGVWYASLLNDMTDPRFPSEVEALFEGRDLRGRAIKVRLTSEGSEHTRLDFITVNSVISEISN
jgi:hypothetical protein